MAPLYTIAYGAQPPQPDQGYAKNSSTLTKLAIGTTGVAAAGFIPFGKGRLWDKYLAAIRAVESGSPASVLRTFRTSELLSPMESWDKISVSGEELRRAGKYGIFAKDVLGATDAGVTLQRTGSVFGEIRNASDEVVGMGLQIQAGTQRGTAIADYFARATGIQLTEHEALNDALLRAKWATRPIEDSRSFGEWLEALEPELRQQRLIVGAKLRKRLTVLGKDLELSQGMSRSLAKLETASRLLRANMASQAGRLNVLLTKPLDIPVLGPILSKIPVLRSMSVHPGSNLEILGRLTKKAVVAGMAWKGLEYIDYLRSKDSPMAPVLSTLGGAGLGALLLKRPGMVFSKAGLIGGAALGLFAGIAPRFDKGLFHGAATIPADINLARLSVSEATGLTESLQEQERVTPGLVSGKAALGFAGVGGLATGLGSHIGFAEKSIAERLRSNTPLYKIFNETREATSGRLAEAVAETKLGKLLRYGKLAEKFPMLKSPIAVGALGGLAAWQILASGLSLMSGNIKAAIPGIGLLGSTTTEEQQQKIYSGEEEVPVRKGRFWEMGRSSAYEGSNILYYRQHALARLGNRSYQKGLYGDEEEKWDYDPTLHPFKALFGSDEWKYHYEIEHQYDRPAPLSSTYGSETPFIGPVVAATFGKLFKPRKLIRANEWLVPGGEGGVPSGEEGFVYRPSSRKEETPSPELGGLGPGAPVAPEEGSQVFNELMYRRREAIGLPGFVEGVVTKGLIGREEIFQNQQTLGTMGDETSSEYWLWKHLNLGGALATSEAVRRFIPRKRSYLEEYNPMRNNLPSWIPDNYFIDLKHGNPLDTVAEGEIRLPGPGYASRFPELQGVSPEKYPLAHRVKILGDVAMYSSAYEENLQKAKRQFSTMSAQEQAIITETERQVKAKKNKKDFAEYRFSGGGLSRQNVTVSEIIDPKRFRTKELGDIIVEAQGVGAVSDKEAAMDFAASNLLGQRISIATPTLESRAYDMVVGGPRLKAVPMLGDSDYGTLLTQQGLAESEELEDEFAKLRFSTNEQVAGRIGEFIMHGMETPLESLTPISPAAKLIRQRSALEDYTQSQAIGCLLPEQYIKTSIGMKYIKDIQIGDIIYTGNGNWESVIGTNKKRMSHDDILIIEQVGLDKRLSIKVTPDHRLLAYKDDKINYIEASSLEKGDYLAYPISKDFIAENKEDKILRISEIINHPRLVKNNNKVKIASLRNGKLLTCNKGRWQEDKIKLDPNFYELYGYFLAEGSTSRQNGYPNKISFSLDIEERDFIDRIKFLIETVFSLPVKEYPHIETNSVTIEACSVVVAMLFESLAGRFSENKQISPFLFKARKECWSTLLRGYINGDGSLSGDRFSITSTSIFLLNQLRDLLFELKLISFFYKRKEKSGEKKSYSLRVSSQEEGYKLFSLIYPDRDNLFDSYSNPKASLVYFKDDFVLSKIKKIICGEWKEDVYDIGIEKDHSFAGFSGQIYHNSDNAFWDRPVENFLKPTANTILYKFGVKNVPKETQQRRAVEEYFDMLKWVKYSRLSAAAKQSDDIGTAAQFKQAAASTLFGADVWGNPAEVMRALPRRERDYFQEFSEAETAEEQQQIMSLIPENEQRVYLAQWLKQAEQASLAKSAAKLNTEADDQTVVAAQKLRASEGFAFEDKEVQQWYEETQGRQPLDDWIRERRAAKYFATHSLPDASWLGWNPSCDLEDVKMKYVETLAMDYHDVDLWDARKRSLGRKPYINDQLIQDMFSYSQYLNNYDVAKNSKMLNSMYGQWKSRVQTTRIDANLGKDQYNIDVRDQRSGLVQKAYAELGV